MGERDIGHEMEEEKLKSCGEKRKGGSFVYPKIETVII